MKEQVLAMKRLWQDEEAEFHGEHVNIEPTWLYPKPARPSGPQVLLGGETDYTLRRVVDYCDGWLPRGNRGSELLKQYERLKEIADEKGRDMQTLTTSIFGAPGNMESLTSFQEAGMDRAILGLPSANRDKVFSILDRYQPLIESFKD